MHLIRPTKKRACLRALGVPVLVPALLVGMALSVHAQFERLPPVPADSPAVEVDRNWAEERLEWSKKIVRGNAGWDTISPYNYLEEARQEPWSWHILPPGLVYRAYLAGVKESRFASVWSWDRHQRQLWDITLGGRVAIVRYGTLDPLLPRGFEVQIEGAAFPRLNPNHNMDLDAADFRFGVPLVYSHGPWEHKFGFYHLSSHLGDELMLRDPSVERINYSRDVLVLALAYRWTPDLRLYAEAGWAFHLGGGSQPWEFQFGADYSPIMPSGIRPQPFFAVNGALREELNFGGNFVAQAGIQWRTAFNGGRFRFGLEYFNGGSREFEFFHRFEQQTGLGLWYDY